MAGPAGAKRSIVVGRYMSIPENRLIWHVFVTIPEESGGFFERYYGPLEGKTYQTENAISGSGGFRRKYSKWQRFVDERNSSGEMQPLR